MTKVMWFSCHEMSAEQIGALKDRLGDIKFVQISKSIQSVDEVKEYIEDNDVIAVVAPPNLLSQFLRAAGDKPVITAKMNRELNEDGSATMTFDKWERVIRIVIEKEDF